MLSSIEPAGFVPPFFVHGDGDLDFERRRRPSLVCGLRLIRLLFVLKEGDDDVAWRLFTSLGLSTSIILGDCSL